MLRLFCTARVTDMAPLDLTAGLTDLAADAPAGLNLELDSEFGALDRVAQGAPEKQYGDKIIPAEEPVWKDVAAQAAVLLERTYDLRVLVHLAVARLHVTGIKDFVAVLTMIRTLLESRWEHVHPQLDPEDDNDPTLRANALLQLAHPIRVLRVLRDMKLAASGRDGAVTWRIIGASIGAIESADENDKKTETVIRAAFAETGPEKTAVLREIVATGARETTAILAAFDTHSGYGNSPDLSTLSKLLGEIERYINNYAVASPESIEEPAAQDASVAGDGALTSTSGAVRTSGISVASLTSVSNRADALRLLDVACRYFEQNEPSSPLPLLIGRARRLADKGFLEILQDLAPDGLGQAQVVVQSRDA